MPTADAHVHLFAGGFEGVHGRSPAGVDELAVYDDARATLGIRRALIVAYEASRRYAGNSEHVLALSHRYEWITPTWYLPIRPQPRPELLRSLAERGVAGYAVNLDTREEGIEFADWPDSVWAEFAEQRAILSLNATPSATAVIAEVIDELHECAVLFSHLGCPEAQACAPRTSFVRRHLDALLRLASRPHVGVKFSGLYAVSAPHHDFPHEAARPFVDLLLDVFGSGRLYWGSDFSPALDFVSLAQLADTRLLAGCSSAEIAAVMGGNLLQLLEDRRQP